MKNFNNVNTMSASKYAEAGMNTFSSHVNFADYEAYVNRHIENQTMPTTFPPELLALTASELNPAPCSNRRDLRALPCFTIDSVDTKDIDDAVCLIKKDDGYELSVHIADVAAYVTPGSDLEADALNRGTSVYLPHMTIPMLPPVLSEDLCSLNPCVDRNAVSVIIDLDKDAKVRKYEITKSLIHSRVKGVYNEIDDIINGNAENTVLRKYNGLVPTLFDMRELAILLRSQREKDGANITATLSGKYVVEGANIVRIVKSKNESDMLIEEFMVLANRLVAEYFTENNLPFIFRTQNVKQTLAGYSAVEGHHAELALQRYMHFTSPIRRLADLKVHQVLTAHLIGKSTDAIKTTIGDNLAEAAEIATRRQRRADDLYRHCEKVCNKYFFTSLQNNEFLAEVIGKSQRNLPIFFLRKYHIRILGRAGMFAAEGIKVAAKISVSNHTGAVEVDRYKIIRNLAA